MLKLERHKHIVSLLGQHGALLVNQIAEILSVSRETVRRDLTELAKKGEVVRSHGGALLAEGNATNASAYSEHASHGVPMLPDLEQQDSFHYRTTIDVERKSKLARKALPLIKPGDKILLDCSTTNWFLARQLPDIDLTVVSQSTAIIQMLMSRKAMRLIGLGGDYSSIDEAFFGDLAIKSLEDMDIDTFFFSCQGFDKDRGIFTGSRAQATLLRHMFLVAKQVVMIVDASKQGQLGKAHVCGFGELDILITEKFEDPLLAKEMIWHNVQTIYA
ncbi:DeoR/GlpR family DNA-binding transcription regulator [Vibrio superstes]|uniref:DeoR family transcriptional regulator n=1 Tax=Vibrio superstes NBRC 103154 TaxID=1219062 RepID=A0A511QVL9_9VIBR|nr:DeoR/GlpR family DNA-binding transcription regulator [Vibrio superstes]GEM81421.1 DeoR family transcriptional regulator [Vibrio superstes NBRC 103154]